MIAPRLIFDQTLLAGDFILVDCLFDWEIEGFSKVPCGGTHVKSTAEVGFVTLKRINIGGGKERIEIRLVNE